MKIKLEEKTFRKLLLVPLLIIIISIALITLTYVEESMFLKKSIDLEGGTQLTIHYPEKVNTNDFESALINSLGTSDVDVVTTTDPSTRKQETIVVSVGGEVNTEQIIEAVESNLEIKLEPTKYSIRTIGPALAGSFWNQAKWAFLFAFIFMVVVVLSYFKKPIVSAIILIAVGADIIVILGFMNFLGIRLSLATIAAILMILGYGADSNILLSTKLVKEKEGETFDRIRNALKTGLTMSASTISALTALLIITNSIILKQIATVLLIGLIADLFNTWILNANLLLWRLK